MTMMTKVTKNEINNSLRGISVGLFSPGSAYLIRNVQILMIIVGRAQADSPAWFKAMIQILQSSVAEKARRGKGASGSFYISVS